MLWVGGGGGCGSDTSVIYILNLRKNQYSIFGWSAVGNKRGLKDFPNISKSHHCWTRVHQIIACLQYYTYLNRKCNNRRKSLQPYPEPPSFQDLFYVIFQHSNQVCVTISHHFILICWNEIQVATMPIMVMDMWSCEA